MTTHLSHTIINRAKHFYDNAYYSAIPTFSGLEALRFVWMGLEGEDTRFIAIAWSEKDFEARCLKAANIKQSATFPWLHGQNALKNIVNKNFNHLGQDDFQSFDLMLKAAPDNSFSLPRTQNFFCFLQFKHEDTLLNAAKKLCGDIAGAHIHDALGFDLNPQSIIMTEPTLFDLDINYFDHPDFQNRIPLEPFVQVDGLANIYWVSLTAAARALGAPPEISTSLSGIRFLLGHGDIISAVNHIASADPLVFREKFKDALAPYQKNDPLNSKEKALAEFALKDRRAFLEHMTPTTILSHPRQKI